LTPVFWERKVQAEFLLAKRNGYSLYCLFSRCNMADYGFLVPTGGGEDIPLKKERIVIGRRENCDIVLRFSNVSGQHCRMTLEQGYWFIKDLDSRNGTGYRVTRKRLDPGVIVSIAKHQYEIRYNPEDLGAMGPPPADDDQIDMSLRSSLMERAGLDKRSPKDSGSREDLSKET
jgi:hypothetical protein